MIIIIIIIFIFNFNRIVKQEIGKFRSRNDIKD